jgi:hypothetical protein
VAGSEAGGAGTVRVPGSSKFLSCGLPIVFVSGALCAKAPTLANASAPIEICRVNLIMKIENP